MQSKVYAKEAEINWEKDDRPLLDSEQIFQLEILCEQFNVDMKVLKKLLFVEKDYAGYKFRRGINEEIAKILRQDYYTYSKRGFNMFIKDITLVNIGAYKGYNFFNLKQLKRKMFY